MKLAKSRNFASTVEQLSFGKTLVQFQHINKCQAYDKHNVVLNMLGKYSICQPKFAYNTRWFKKLLYFLGAIFLQHLNFFYETVFLSLKTALKITISV